jgi:hypothetical protein
MGQTTKIFKLFLFIAVSIIFFTSCKKDELTTTTTGTTLTFHCSIHNLTYRVDLTSSTADKTLSMPCPECNPDAAYAFMTANSLYTWEIQCPVDSAWTPYSYTCLNYKNITSWPIDRLARPVAWLPTITYDSIKNHTPADLQLFVATSATNIFDNDYPYFLCKTCFNKVCTAAITTKNDSISTFHNYINGIIGMTFDSYPFKTGSPVDRRVRAQAILDSIQNILPNISNSNYISSISSINNFVGGWDGARQDYIYCQKTGTAQGSYVDYNTCLQAISDAYISDTVIINIAGGPDYANGGYYYIPTWQSKSSTYTVQNKTSRPPSFYNTNVLSHGGMTKVRLNSTRSRSSSSSSATYQLLSTFQPGSVDLLPYQYLPRKYNTYTTSVFNLWQPQKGNSTTYYDNGSSNPTWSYYNLANTVGGWQNKWPYNIVSDQSGELLNDVGVMEIRTVVNWCKARGKHIVLMGSSWGGAMIFDYLRYYGSSDFDLVFISDQNPNMPSDIVSSEMETYIYQSGTAGVTTDMNVNMCVIASDVYRRMNWLSGQNLSNVTFYCAQTDTNVGMIPSSDIATLKSCGATVYAFPAPITHGIFQDNRAWYRYVIPTLQ